MNTYHLLIFYKENLSYYTEKRQAHINIVLLFNFTFIKLQLCNKEMI